MCQDLHTIKMFNDEPYYRRKEGSESLYGLDIGKGNDSDIPPNYCYPDFDFTFFWKLNDVLHYFKYIWKNGQAIPMALSDPSETDNKGVDDHKISRNNRVKFQSVVWIDNRNNGNEKFAQKLRDIDLDVQFCETFRDGIEHIQRIMFKIKSCQIICRGYYADEKRNPLNLLAFLNEHSLYDISVIVFTKDEPGLMYNLKKQAPSMEIFDWQQRLHITSNPDELFRKIKEKAEDEFID